MRRRECGANLRVRFGRRAILGLASVLLVSGCAEELGSTKKPAAHVAGRVHVGGLPVGGGWIEFYPVDGTVGDLRSAPLGKDGTFEATKVAVGSNLIRIVHPPPSSRVPDPFRQTYSPIRRQIRGPSDRIEVDLLEEARKEAALRAQARG